jgi:RHH-type proline utilization regulon transcriptional repressor/proline dehydrogenase/delta 1-pyrroline-5-carboxylate dehydrogenase
MALSSLFMGVLTMWFKKEKTSQFTVSSDATDAVAFGTDVFKNSQSHSSGKTLLDKEWWYTKVMDWSMKSNDFKTRMFRFVDVFPYLNSGNDILDHVREYFEDDNGKLPSLFQFGSAVGQLAPGLVSKSVEKNIQDMARLFITGDTPEDALKKLTAHREQGWAFTADLLGEVTLSEVEALDYKNRYMDLINKIHDESQKWEHDPILDENHLGKIPQVNVSVKLSALYSQIKIAAWDETKATFVERLKPIFRLAMEKNAFINVDMEHYEYKNLTLEVFEDLISLEEFASYPHWGIVIQAYLKDSFNDCEKLVAFAKRRGVPFTVRLVKGAYWDHEVIHAKQMDWPIPVYTLKENSDFNYENCARLLLQNYKHLHTALGSHNIRSLSEAISFAKKNNVPKNAFEVQMLYGMGDQFKTSFRNMGYRVREYATIGDLVPGMAYLVRRLLENSSNESFLQNKLKKDSDPAELLAAPKYQLDDHLFAEDSHDFNNSALLDFTLSPNRQAYTKALSAWEKTFETPQTIKAVIGGTEGTGTESIERFNPSKTGQKLYTILSATSEETETALNTAFDYQKKWSRTLVEDRALMVEKIANLIQENRFELAALQSIEVGKPWKEADGDITEAIDFCRYYAADMRKLGKPFRVGHAPGEESLYHYRARGVIAVIAPWNFPLAILCGMVTSALVTGNTVLLKPAEQSSLTAQKLFELIMKAGVPKEACHFLPGLGEKVGAQIVESPKTSVISFTGSKEVGLQIIEKAAKVHPGQEHVKKAIVEMGGKNALIIDSDADLDQAVSAVLASAFAFSGQKCSALSRAVVLEGIYDKFCDRLKAAVESLHTGDSTNPKFYLGPVVDETSYNRILKTIAKNKELFAFTKGVETTKDGNFVEPHVFFDVDPNSELAQEEIFGPVLAVIKAKDFSEAIEIANGTKYALTAGIYSRMPSHIERARLEIECGNFYINRSITGAMVNRHPFGGYKMSGLGSKTGGPDYLKNFMEPRVMIENLVRQGFSPDLLEKGDRP